MDNNYLCKHTTCTITTKRGGDADIQKEGHLFLFICGDFEGGTLRATGGNLNSITPFCASLFSCSDPQSCWMEDIKAFDYETPLTGVKALSIMPGCKVIGEGETICVPKRDRQSCTQSLTPQEALSQLLYFSYLYAWNGWSGIQGEATNITQIWINRLFGQAQAVWQVLPFPGYSVVVFAHFQESTQMVAWIWILTWPLLMNQQRKLTLLIGGW